jgi:hypothetical protein
MVDDGSTARESAFDGASWVYLISSSAGVTGEDPLRGSDGECSPVSGIEAMLARYERARVVSCGSPDECAGQLRAVLSDPEFGATMSQAVGEQATAP